MADEIPVEIRARVEANMLFDAIRDGDYASAAQAQERLRELGWIVRRDSTSTRRKAPKPKGGA